MCANWADNEQKSKNYAQALLVPVNDQFGFDKNGRLGGYNISAFNEFVSAIESYVRFHDEIPESQKFKLLSSAVWAAAKDKKLDAENLLGFLKTEESQYLSTPKENYELAGSISIKYFKELNRSRLNPPIKFAGKVPGKLDFGTLLKPFSYIGIKQIPDSYTFFRIPVKARNPYEAYHLGIDAIDLLRAIWNWYFKPTEYLFNSDQSRKPMNFITPGPFHAVINPDGTLFKDFWYEPEFQEHPLDISKDWEKLTGFERRSRRAISKHPYRAEIEKALRKFTQALDHRDKHVSFLQLWLLLEKLTATNNARYEELIKRVSFLYVDAELHKAVLNHLRLFRNSSVHDGKQANRIEKYLYQIKGYVQDVIGFHINNIFKATSLADAVSYLDYPTDHGVLSDRSVKLRKVMKFRKR